MRIAKHFILCHKKFDSYRMQVMLCDRYVKFLSNFKFNVIYYRGLAANGMERQNNHFYRGKKEILPSISSSPPSLMFLAQAMYFISTFYNSTSYIASNPTTVK